MFCVIVQRITSYFFMPSAQNLRANDIVRTMFRVLFVSGFAYIDLTNGAMAKHRVFSREEGPAKNRDIRRSRWETKVRVYPRGPSLNPPGRAQWRVPTFTFCSKVITLRGNPTARRNHDRSRCATRAQILSHPRCTIYQRERASELRPRRPPRSAVRSR